MTIKSILSELESVEPRDKHLLVEAKANHAIVSAINVLRLINENFDAKDSDELTRRFLNSIKGSDPKKFQRKIRQLKETKE